jgi:hypothetical protein
LITGLAEDDFGDGGLEIVATDDAWETEGMTFSFIFVDSMDTVGDVGKELGLDADSGGKK